MKWTLAWLVLAVWAFGLLLWNVQTPATPSGLPQNGSDLTPVLERLQSTTDTLNRVMVLVLDPTCQACMARLPEYSAIADSAAGLGFEPAVLIAGPPSQADAMVGALTFPAAMAIDSSRTLFERVGIGVVPSILLLESDGTLLHATHPGLAWPPFPLMRQVAEENSSLSALVPSTPE